MAIIIRLVGFRRRDRTYCRSFGAYGQPASRARATVRRTCVAFPGWDSAPLRFLGAINFAGHRKHGIGSKRCRTSAWPIIARLKSCAVYLSRSRTRIGEATTTDPAKSAALRLGSGISSALAYGWGRRSTCGAERRGIDASPLVRQSHQLPGRQAAGYCA